MLATLQTPVEVWLVGELSIEVGEYVLYFQAKVARARGREVGLVFKGVSEANRASVEVLVDLAAALGPPIGEPKQQS